MSTLSNTNVSWDGMRDMFDGTGTSGSTNSWAINCTDGLQRYPFINGGQGSGKRPTSSSHSDPGTSTTISANDLKSIVRVDFALQQWNVGITKESVTHSAYAWGTNGGMDAMTAGGVNQTQGSLFDGTTNYTSSAKAFDEINSGFDDNKDLHGVGYLLNPIGRFYVVFAGSGSATGDTDWTTMYVSHWDANSSRYYGASYARSSASTNTYTSGGTDYHRFQWALASEGIHVPGGGTWIHSLKFV